MNFDDWQADVSAGSALHASGFSLRIEGDPRDPEEVFPGRFPEGLSFVDQARLLRAGLTVLAKAAQQSPHKPELKSAGALQREAIAKQFAERSDKRPRLSLKKNQEVESE